MNVFLVMGFFLLLAAITAINHGLSKQSLRSEHAVFLYVEMSVPRRVSQRTFDRNKFFEMTGNRNDIVNGMVGFSHIEQKMILTADHLAVLFI